MVRRRRTPSRRRKFELIDRENASSFYEVVRKSSRQKTQNCE